MLLESFGKDEKGCGNHFSPLFSTFLHFVLAGGFGVVARYLGNLWARLRTIGTPIFKASREPIGDLCKFKSILYFGSGVFYVFDTDWDTPGTLPDHSG